MFNSNVLHNVRMADAYSIMTKEEIEAMKLAREKEARCTAQYYRWMVLDENGGYKHTGVNPTYAEFDTVGDAEDMLVGCGYVEQAIKENWFLVLFRMDSVPVDFTKLLEE